MKKVIIDIKSTQGLDNDENVIELTTLGQLAFKNGKYYLFYSEGETLGKSGVKTTLKADGNNRVVMTRSGALEGRLIITKGQRNQCFYSTEYGQVMLGLFGESIENNLNDNGGSLNMCYTIDVDNGLLSRNKVEINVREVNK